MHFNYTKGDIYFNIMVFFNPDSIPKDILIEFFEANNDTQALEHDKDHLQEIMPNLVRRGLIHRVKSDDDNVSFSMYRTLQHALIVKLGSKPNEAQKIFSHAYRTVRRFMPETSPTQTPNKLLWPQLDLAALHVLRLRQLYISGSPISFEGSLTLAKMFYDAGFHIWEVRSLDQNEGASFLAAAERILQSMCREINTEIKLQADIQAMMSQLIENIGVSKWPEVIDRRQKARIIRKELLDDEKKRSQIDPSHKVDPDIELQYYNAVNDDGVSACQRNEFLQAHVDFNQRYEQYQKWGNKQTHAFEYAKHYHNMAYIRMYEGKYKNAIDLAQKGVSLVEPGTARYCWFQYDLACIILQSGNLQQALELHLNVLSLRKEICGERSSS
ncbi:hypothetical protein OCU04_001990 [Sclerotinia nivalis]|uniref:DUF7779 domain-containing protein n=1 Tax=Sclerotinia nivalis TaxID=352851 RepID=A0A9X0DQ02_9HELO|nr:hypothetical protein OCU04_001990 [Sclerotinia nivalis]